MYIWRYIKIRWGIICRNYLLKNNIIKVNCIVSSFQSSNCILITINQSILQKICFFIVKSPFWSQKNRFFSIFFRKFDESSLSRESIICILRLWLLFVAFMLKNIIFAFLTGFWLLVDAIKIKKNHFFLKSGCWLKTKTQTKK